MSRSKSKRSAPKYQRAKLAALPFLFAVLGYVLLAGSSSEEEQPAAVRAATLTASASRQRPAAVAGGEPRDAQSPKLPKWSELAATARGQCNPFLPMVREAEKKEAPPQIAMPLPPFAAQSPHADTAAATEPPFEPPAEPDASAVAVAGLSQQPVRYFFQTNNRRIMLVGDQLLSEGQALESYTVTRLEPNRIELEPANAKP